MKPGLKKLLKQELEQKQIALFSRGHQGRKNARRYIQLIDAQAELSKPIGKHHGTAHHSRTRTPTP